MAALGDVELRLLRHSCGLPPAPATEGNGAEGAAAAEASAAAAAAAQEELAKAAELIVHGRFLSALTDVPQLRALLDTLVPSGSGSASVHDSQSYYHAVAARALSAVSSAADAAVATGEGAGGGGAAAGPSVAAASAVLAAGVACLHVFAQYNLTGPFQLPPPPTPLDLFAPAEVASSCAQLPRASAAPPSLTIGTAAAGAAAPPAPPPQQPVAGTATSNGAAPSASGAGAAASNADDGLGGLGVDTVTVGDRWAERQLRLDGEDVAGRCPAMQWLLLARLLLVSPLNLAQPSPSAAAAGGGEGEAGNTAAASAAAPADARAGAATARILAALPPSWSWWALRCVMLHQAALEGRSYSLLREASQLVAALVAWYGDSSTGTAAASAPPYRGCRTAQEAAAVGGMMHVELGLCQYAYGYVEAGRSYLSRAGELLGLQPQLTGAMGKRTVHQIDPKAQLVVVASPASRAVPPSDAGDTPAEQLGLGALGSAPSNPDLQGFQDASEVFPAPRLVGGDGALLEARYSAAEQALLLAWATAVKKGTSADDLQEWQMAPWVEAVLMQPRTRFLAAAAARLLKIRHERERPRTRERALLQIDQLVEAVGGAPVATATSEGPEAVAGARAALCWAVSFPLQVSLRREAAELYVSMGLVGAAMREFEALELWDAAITCYRLTGKKALAEELVNRRLAATPEDPRLWCALGDLHLDDRYYEEAWKRSGHRHSRSQRSLARSAMRRKDYAKASEHWEAALALNPLHPEAQFALGFCRLKENRFRDALRAFTHVTQQEPDNGEAWNNIAALWMHLGGYRPAFSAVSEAVRYKHDSWQTWENYARAAVASGHWQQAARGLQKSLQLSSGQRLFIDVAEGLLDALEGRPPRRDAGTLPEAAAAAAAEGLAALGMGAGDAAAGDGGIPGLEEEEAALGVPLLPLLLDVPLPSTSATDTAAAGGGAAEAEAEPPVVPSGLGGAAAAAGTAGSAAMGSGSGAAAKDLVSGRERGVVVATLGSVLREALNGAAAAPALWGSLARLCTLRGEHDGAQEARVKQVRGLASGAYKSELAKFVEYAEASEAMCRCYLRSHAAGRPGSTKDLAAGRMHLRGLLRATAEKFGDHPLTACLQALLDEVTAAEDAAIAAAREAKAAAAAADARV